ncbi:hypothetical protein B0T24DRAFT_677300 [Lasiosphaeria ovina]|uniref:Uncharacterized protein n=1 Tax=Lasiosphaeria ovina TaxID=92902 RepID=A0AAE0NA39_9PEZI|nr:hypothetical protein B0T24DRAFT_677300 [Lasiosphaeria ovina]
MFELLPSLTNHLTSERNSRLNVKRINTNSPPPMAFTSTLLLPGWALALAARSTRAAPARTGPLAATTTLARTRLYHATAAARSFKGDQDRESLKPRPSDSTRSGSDDDVAAHNG